MSSPLPIRVLSDLHLGHPGSLIRSVAQVEPLLEGARTVVFNGDTVELRLRQAREFSRRAVSELEALCAARGVSVHLINGNHDPDISAVDHLDLLEGRLLVTHGHVLFPEITPWGREARVLREEHLRILAEVAGEHVARLEDRLEAVRQACLRTAGPAGKFPETRLEWLACVFSEMLHPRRPLQVFRSWLAAPALAAGLLEAHRPAAQCLLIGHTHFPGRWKRGDRLVVNTGSFLPGFGRSLVDVTADQLVVRAVDSEGGRFRPGRVLEHFPLRPRAVPTPDPALVPPRDLPC